MTNDDHNARVRIHRVATQISSMLLALAVGGFVAIVTVLVFATVFQPYKEMMPVAFVVATVVGSVCGLGLRRLMLALPGTNTRDDEQA